LEVFMRHPPAGLRHVAIVACAACTLHAPAASAMTFGLEAFGAFNTHAMEFWNTDLELANLDGGHFNRLGHTLTGGGGLRFGLDPRWMIEAAWEPLSLSSRDEPTGRALSFEAQSFQLGASCRFPSRRAARGGIAAGLGYYDIRGWRESAGIRNARLSGGTLGFEVGGIGEWALRPGLSLAGRVGYRRASVADTRVDGASYRPRIVTDLSGLSTRFGLAIDLPVRRGGGLRVTPAHAPE
jgi:hypothetical protein